MKVLDYSEIPFDGGNLTLEERIKGIAKYGFSWVSKMQSQEKVIVILHRVLDKRFTLLRNFPLPGGAIRIPFVLVGPHGVTVVNLSTAKGIYRAQGDSWTVMDTRSKSFRPVRPNLIVHTKLMTKAMETLLSQIGYAIEAEGILMFTDPKAHVETIRPDVRVILVDAIERFGLQLRQTAPVMELEDVRIVVNDLNKAIQPKEESGEAVIRPHKQLSRSLDSGFMKMIDPLMKKLNFSRGQWIFLGVFLFLEIVVLTAFLIYILLTA